MNPIKIKVGDLCTTRSGRKVEIIKTVAMGSEFYLAYRDCKSGRVLTVSDEGRFVGAEYEHEHDLILTV